MLRLSCIRPSLQALILNGKLCAPTTVSCAWKHDTKKSDSSSFALNIFRGILRPEDVFPFKEVLTNEQKDTVRGMIDPIQSYFKEQNNALENDEKAGLDDSQMKALGALGIFGLQVPEDLGGIGLCNTQYARMVEIVGEYDLGVGIVLGAHQSIGFKGILLAGTDAQKAKYLPALAAGEKIAAFCLTEPSSGSDAGSIRCRVVPSDDGKYYILNGTKCYISNGGIAHIMTVFAQMAVKDKKTGAMKDKVTAFIVERDFGGVTSGAPEKKMGIKCSNTSDVYYENVKIPKENLLGEEGGGFKVAMNILNNGRFGMGAALAGTMRTCISMAVDHATNRTQFGKKLKEFGIIQEKIARMTMAHYVNESIAYTLCGIMDSGVKEYQVEAAISKIYASEAVGMIADETQQILAGTGYMRATGIERIVRDARIFRIFEGTSEILKLFIALTGIQYAGSHLKEVQKAFKNPGANLGLIFSEAKTRGMRVVAQSMGGSTGPSMTEYVHPQLVGAAGKVSPYIENFGIEVESLLIKYNRGVVDQQFQLYRLAEAAIEIYAMVAILSRCTRSLQLGHASAQHEAMIVDVYCSEGCDRVKYLLRGLRNDKVNHKRFDYIEKISREVVGNGGLITQHPLGI